jgi:hypothetical protein
VGKAEHETPAKEQAEKKMEREVARHRKLRIKHEKDDGEHGQG